jgi:hypothetical protein
MYLNPREGWGHIPTTPRPRNLTQSGYGVGPPVEGFGQTEAYTRLAGPVFDIQCPNPPGCPPVAAGQCRAILRQAIIGAIKLANGAAIKVDKATKIEPAKRDAETRETARLFMFFFGHDPSHPVSWAGNEPSGVSVAKRFLAVASELGGGRRIVFRCGCPGAGAGVRARTNQAAEPNVVNLCARFWNPPPGLRGLPAAYFRAGVILHETLHIYFHEFFHHAGHPSGDPERRRDNAHCFEAFALRVAGFGADPQDVRQCSDNLAGNLGGWGMFGQPAPLPPTPPAPRRVFDPFKAAREAAEKIVPIRPETVEERIQRIVKERPPTLPRGRSFKEWFDEKMAERRVPKWLRDSIWKSIFDKNWGLLSNLLSTAGFSGAIKESIIETARAASEVKVR